MLTFALFPRFPIVFVTCGRGVMYPRAAAMAYSGGRRVDAVHGADVLRVMVHQREHLAHQLRLGLPWGEA